MTNARHSRQTIVEGIHTPVSFIYADEAARLAAGPFEAEDLYKLAIQEDNSSIWILVDISPITWKEGFISPPIALSNVLDAGNTTDGYHIEFTDGSYITTDDGYLSFIDTNLSVDGYVDMTNHNIVKAKIITFNSEYSNGTSGASLTINWNNGQKQTVTLSANCTLTFTAPILGVGNLLLRIVQDSTARVVTWPGSVVWAGGTPPTLSTSSGAIDIFSFYFNGTTYFGVASLNFA